MNAPRKIPISHNLYRGQRLTNPLDLLGMQFRQVATWVSKGKFYFTHQ